MSLNDIVQVDSPLGMYRAKVVSLVAKDRGPVLFKCEFIEGPQDGVTVTIEDGDL